MNAKPIILILCICSCFLRAELRYHVCDLTQQAIDSSAEIIPAVGYCINDNGDVAGHGSLAQYSGVSKAFKYDSAGGRFINLGNLAGSFVSGYGGNAYGINNNGLAVGRNSISDTSYSYRAFVFNDIDSDNAADSGEMVNILAVTDYGYGWAEDINDHGRIVGYAAGTDSSYYGWTALDSNRDNEYSADEISFFPKNYYAVSVNNSGTIALSYNGYVCIWYDSNDDRAYSDEEMVIMDMPTGYLDSHYNINVGIDEVSPVAINNYGDICGSAENTNGKANGFFWHDYDGNKLAESDEITVFGSELKQTHVRAMNDDGIIVGGTFEFGSDRAAFAWSCDNGLVNLNDLADLDSFDDGQIWLTQAEGINGKGQIVVSGGYDTDGNGKIEEDKTFILSPYYQGDINSDGVVDMRDFTIFARSYLTEGEGMDAADLDKSGYVDIYDLCELIKDWTK